MQPKVETSAPRAARRELQRFAKFLVVGVTGFVVDTGVLTALVFFFSTDRRLAKGVAFCFAVATTFVMNRFWAYRESRSKTVLAQIAQFLLISLVGLGINLLVFAAVDHALHARLGSIIALYAAQVAAVGTALVWNFAANRLITYGDVKLGE